MDLSVMQTRGLCADAAMDIGRVVREAVQALPLHERSVMLHTPLKPSPSVAAACDLVGEQAAFGRLHELATSTGCEVRVIVDPASRLYHALLPATAHHHDASAPADRTMQRRIIWVYLDAVDGTLKLSGLGNAPGRLRAANDGGWAIGVALTDPTDVQEADCLSVGSFTVAAVIDGNPASCPACPTAAVATAVHCGADCSATNQVTGTSYETRNDGGRLLHTTTNTTLGQTFAYLDSFQAWDHRTAASGDAALSCRLYAALMDRHCGGAFDVLRTYGNLSSLLRTMLAYRGGGRDPCTAACPGAGSTSQGDEQSASCSSFTPGELWWEPACGVFLAVNENLANLIPSVPLILGAGGVATDFEGRPLLQRPLSAGRTSVVYAANATLHAAVMRIIEGAKRGGERQGDGDRP